MKALEYPFTHGNVDFTDNKTVFGEVAIPEGSWCIIRVDGRAFHTYTRPFKKDGPFSKAIITAMDMAAVALLNEFKAEMVYWQSDEITVIIPPERIPFSGKTHKLNSIAASVATAAFNRQMPADTLKNLVPPGAGIPDAIFDARAFAGDREDCALCIMWRQRDCIKNSVSAAAQSVYSHKQLEGRNTDDKISMMAEKGLDWYAYSYGIKYGTFIRKVNVEIPVDELESEIPEKELERIRENGGTVTRTKLDFPEFPVLTTVANLEGMLFDGEAPIQKETKNEEADI